MGSLTPNEKQLPVVDFTKLEMKPGSNSWSSTCNQVKKSLENHGCFVALYNKISPQLHKSIFQSADELFDLPIQTKLLNRNEKSYHGYVGQSTVIPLHEGLGIDYATTLQGAQTFTNRMWPNGGNHSFCETSLSFAKTVAELEQIVVRMLFDSYGLLEKHVDSHIDSTTYLLRYLKYRAPETGESNMGMPSHTDKSFISILYQNDVSGLEVKTRDREWIHVDFPPSSFVVMAGDACQAWSNDRVHSASHKVTLDENGKATRYTIALFSFQSKPVEAPKELVDDDEHPLKYKPFVHADLITFFKTDRGRQSQDILTDFCGV
ncbi:probable 2-oxoglutarate-dependent dioxygenase AOP1 [Henckelia pumila]|uniref:probable 2-oxoglutarate-dependent dioxygenase AOP1 n=1 Tax=Henckelia pumila TaxID=405737 RepID=UPI003C6DF9AC